MLCFIFQPESSGAGNRGCFLGDQARAADRRKLARHLRLQLVPLSQQECRGHRPSKSVDLAKQPGPLPGGAPDASPPSNHHHGGKVMTALCVCQLLSCV